MAELPELNIDNTSRKEELEQCGRRLCLRIDGVPTVKDESVMMYLAMQNLLFYDITNPYN